MSDIPKIEIEDGCSFILEHDYYNPEPEPEKPGYCRNPFLRLNQLMEIPEDPYVQSLYGYALALEEIGNSGDFEKKLDKLTLEMKEGLYSFFKVGCLAWKIKLLKAWRVKYKSFGDYCKRGLGFSAGNINYQIRAACIVSELMYLGFICYPKSVAQCSVLYPYWISRKLDLELFWDYILEKYPMAKVTAKILDNELKQLKSEDYTDSKGLEDNTVSVRLPKELIEQYRIAARKRGTNYHALTLQVLDSWISSQK